MPGRPAAVRSIPPVDRPGVGADLFRDRNASPGYDDYKRPGDNLYTASLVALDIQTGALRWYHQIVPHDIWGYDVASPPVLFDFLANGTTVRAVAEASKSAGCIYSIGRRAGHYAARKPLFPRTIALPQTDSRGMLIAPGAAGGANWPPTSYSPKTGWLYVSGTHNPTRYQLKPGEAGQPERIVISFDKTVERWGTLSAIAPQDGKIKWQVKTDLPLVSGSLATAGGLIFHGESNGKFVARNTQDGTALWHFNTGAGSTLRR